MKRIYAILLASVIVAAALLLKNVLRYGALPGRRILISPTIKLND